MGYFGKAIDFLKAPGKSFEAVERETLGEAFKYMLVLGLVVSVLGGIVAGVMASLVTGPLTTALGYTGAFLPIAIVGATVVTYIALIIGQTIYGLWLHLWAYILGARKGLKQTMKSVYYGGTPNYLLGWIPVISIIFGLWSLVLAGLGLTKLQGMTGGRAAIAIIVAIAIPIIIIGALFATFLFGTVGTLGGYSPYLGT